MRAEPRKVGSQFFEGHVHSHGYKPYQEGHVYDAVNGNRGEAVLARERRLPLPGLVVVIDRGVWPGVEEFISLSQRE